MKSWDFRSQVLNIDGCVVTWDPLRFWKRSQPGQKQGEVFKPFGSAVRRAASSFLADKGRFAAPNADRPWASKSRSSARCCSHPFTQHIDRSLQFWLYDSTYFLDRFQRFSWFKATFGHHFQPPGEDHGKFAEPLLLHRCGDVLRRDVKLSRVSAPAPSLVPGSTLEVYRQGWSPQDEVQPRHGQSQRDQT